MTKKRVLVLASTFPTFVEGDVTPPFVFELSKRLISQFDVVVLAPHSSCARVFQKTDGLIIHRFKYWFGKKKLADGAILPNLKRNKLLYFQIPFFLVSQFFTIKKLQKKYDFDTIHAHWLIPQGFLAVFFKKATNWKGNIVCTTHGGDIFGLQVLNKLKRWIVNNSTALTVVSDTIKKEILKLSTNNIPVEVIPMGVDVTKFNPDKKDSSLKEKFNIRGSFLLFVGRLSEKKGIKYLLEAMHQIIKYSPETKLLIVGNGELEHELINLANNKLKISNNVIFTGGILNSDLPKYYASADIFIGPSIIAKDGDRDGFPVAFMEAMACNTPLVISDLEIFKPFVNGKNAIKAKAKSPEDISNCVIELIANTELQQTISRNNVKEINKTFSAEVVGSRYASVLLN